MTIDLEMTAWTNIWSRQALCNRWILMLFTNKVGRAILVKLNGSLLPIGAAEDANY